MPSKALIRTLLIPPLSICLLLSSALPTWGEGVEKPLQASVAQDALYASSEILLAESTDAGADYLSRLFFFGESTTAHLARTGGVLDQASMRWHVWKDASGTRRLDRRTPNSPVECQLPSGDIQTIPFTEAVKRTQPDILVLSFGLNGITGFLKNKNAFTDSYASLIQSVKEASPNTKIILQSVYPVCRADAFALSLEELTAGIQTVNSWIVELAEHFENVRYADTASVLQNEHGQLKAEYDNSGDGIHLTNRAYQEILWYLRTHAWVEEEI